MQRTFKAFPKSCVVNLPFFLIETFAFIISSFYAVIFSFEYIVEYPMNFAAQHLVNFPDPFTVRVDQSTFFPYKSIRLQMTG